MSKPSKKKKNMIKNQFDLKWIDEQREPVCTPDPNYPNGKDIDASKGSKNVCKVTLPYPARRCGKYLVKCNKCKQLVIVTTAGRVDDPKSVSLACEKILH